MNKDVPDYEKLPVPEARSTGGNVVQTLLGALNGIPNVFQKPLVKAAGRLLYGLADVPAAFLEAIGSDILHVQKTKEQFRSALAKQAIGQLSADPMAQQRALHHFMAETLGKQANRETVLEYAAEELTVGEDDAAASPAPEARQTDAALDDDWLNDFSRKAENASSERLRRLFGKILAGEIRHPGSFSLFTLDFLSKLGPVDAGEIATLAPYVVADTFILTARSKSILTFGLATKMGNLGILSSTSIGVSSATKSFSLSGAPKVGDLHITLLGDSKNLIVFQHEEPRNCSIDCALLTSVGTEVLSLVSSDLDQVMLQELAKSLAGQGFKIGTGKTRKDGATLWRIIKPGFPTA